MLWIGEPKIGQVLRPWPEQQAIVPHRAEVLAIDPDEVDCTSGKRSCRFFSEDAGNCLRSIVQFHVNHLYTVAGLDLLTCPSDVLIDPRLTRPGIPIDRLALC